MLTNLNLWISQQAIQKNCKRFLIFIRFRTDKVTGFIDHAAWVGLQTPHAYNSILLDKIKPRMPEYSQNSKVIRFKTSEKTDEPSPHSYEPNDL